MKESNNNESDLSASKERSQGRWWEFYFVRYFVGTVFGTVLIIFLANHPSSGIKKLISQSIQFTSLKDINGMNVWIFLLIGLAFCYLASAPVLVLHSFRGSLFFLSKARLCKYKERWIQKLILSSPIIIISIYTLRRISLNWQNNSEYYFYLFSSIIIAQIALILIDIWYGTVNSYYTSLCSNRSVKTATNNEIVESYKHLREHGNAFMIILMEFILGVVLYNISNISVLIFVVITWIFPATLVWFCGTSLEYNQEVK